MIHAFTVYPVSPDRTELTFWRVDDPRVENLWLPLVGPTPWALLRLLDRVLADQAEHGAPATFVVTDTAEQLGVGPKRVVDSIYRLRSRFHLLDEDQIETTYDRPVFTFRRVLRPIGEKEWRRLPASVREKYATVEL